MICLDRARPKKREERGSESTSRVTAAAVVVEVRHSLYQSRCTFINRVSDRNQTYVHQIDVCAVDLPLVLNFEKRKVNNGCNYWANRRWNLDGGTPTTTTASTTALPRL